MDNRRRFIVRYSKTKFVLRYDEDAEHAVWNSVWNLDVENQPEVLLECREYKPEIDSKLRDWEGPLFSENETCRPFKPNWVVRFGNAERVLADFRCGSVV